MLNALLISSSSSLGFSAPLAEGAVPLACQPNAEQPMLPIFHLIGNVTKSADGSIKLEDINDCSGVTYSGGLYHVFHQCCQNHFDHAISKDLIHWQRLPPPIQPVSLKTWDGSVTMLSNAEGGPIILYDAQDGHLDYENMPWSEYLKHAYAPRDKPILGVARLADLSDKYLMNWTREASNPVIFDGAPGAFPSQIFKSGDHYNMVMQGARYQSNDTKFMHWKNQGEMVGHSENGGQWWMHTPNQIDGSAPPAGVADHIVNIRGGADYLFGNYDAAKETFTPWSPDGPPPPTPTPPPGPAPGPSPTGGQEAHLEGGGAGWWGAQMTHDPEGKVKDRMMMIGWGTPDYHGPAGPGIDVVTRLTGMREVNFDTKTMNLVANPLPELKGLRTGVVASEKGVALPATGAVHAVALTAGGAAASADVEITFYGIGGTANFGACVLVNSTNEGGLGISITVTNQSGTRIATVVAGECGATAKYHGGPQIPLFDEETVTVRITPDRSLADFFVQGGRWAGTVAWMSKLPRKAEESAVVLWSNTAGVTADVDVYGMGCGWLFPSYTENPTI